MSEKAELNNYLYSLKKISRSFDKREVLSINSLNLEAGIIYGLLGPNGAGKTTLMRILSFMDHPSSGDIFFYGEKVSRDQAASLRAKVVWVPQVPVMLTGTLLYNVEFPMALKKVKRRERRERAMELIKLVRLEHLSKAEAPKLSGGEAQRASIARALAAGAEVILFDEPTANVDFRSRSEIIELIRRLNKEHGLSIIVTSHDADFAARLCHRNITLFDGKVVSEMEQGEGLGEKRFTLTVPATFIEEEGSLCFAVEAGLLQGLQSEAELLGFYKSQAGVEVLLKGQESSLNLVLEKEKDIEILQKLKLGQILALKSV